MTTTINASTSSGLVNTADTSGILQLQTASTAAVTINASQNVGVGASTPLNRLHVSQSLAGSASSSAGIARIANTRTNTGDGASTLLFVTDEVDGSTQDKRGQIGGEYDGSNGGRLVFSTAQTTTQTITERMRIDSSGNVGIGNTAPADRLQIEKASANCLLSVSRTTGGAGGRLVMQHTDSVGALQTTASVPLTFGTNDTERMRITSGGVLLLNETSTGSSPLMQISGDTSSYNNLTIKDTGTTYSTGNRFAMFTNSSNAVAGQIQHTGVTTTAFATSSDARLKENIVDAPNALDKIMDIKVRSYDWKEDSSHVEYGFVAQEVNEVYGEPVGVGGEDVKDDPWNIEYGRLTPILLKAIQELNAKVDAQALEIQALKGAK
jgi:hypothetical protein